MRLLVLLLAAAVAGHALTCPSAGGDQAAAVQAAIDATANGATLTIACQYGIGAAGIHMTSRTNVTLAGVTGGGFQSLAVPAQTVPSGLAPVMLLISACNNCTAKNLIWDGNAQAAAPFGVTGSTGVTLSGNTISNVAYPANGAIEAIGNTSCSYVDNVISNLGTGTFGGNPDGTRGMWLGNTGGGNAETTPTITGNRVTGAGATGIGVLGSGGTISGNTVSGSLTGGAGIKIYELGAAAWTIANNTLVSNTGQGLQIDERTTPIIIAIVTGNYIYNNALNGIYANATMTASLFSGNTIIHNHTSGSGGWMAGIAIFAANGLIVEKNTVTLTDNGIIVDSINSQTVAGLIVRNNTIQSNTVNGIAIYNDAGSVAGVAMSTNIVSGNGTGVFVQQKMGGTITGTTLDCLQVNTTQITDNRGGGALPAVPACGSCR